MSTVMTNIEFAKRLKDVAQNYKTLYIMGCFGAPMTDSNKKRYCNNYDYNKNAARTAMIKSASSDTFGFDCVCLIKGILWGWNGDASKVYGGASYASNGVPDIGADSMIKVCSGVSTDFSKIEVGEAVWMEGHIGVYIGDGLAVECTPKWKNCVQITACNCSKSGYNRRDWTKHGKLPYVSYEKTSDNNGEQVKQESETVRGIDVSKWQGDIDWGRVKAAGVDFAMIRLGYGSADGNSCGTDGYFEKNVANAIAAGVDIGCYFYSYALSVEAAKKEAEYVIGVLNKYKGVFTYPVAFDIEDKSQAGLGKTVLTDMVIVFGDAIEKAGFYCSLYANLNWLRNYLDDGRLTRFDHWLAQWSANPTYTGAFGMWQSSSKGSVNGINGNVDTDVAYKDYPSIIRSNNLNGFASADQKPTAPTQPEATTKPAFSSGDVVSIAKNAVYYNGATVPDWVIAKQWIVKECSGDRAVIDKSVDGANAICSPINTKYLSVIKADSTASASQSPASSTAIKANDVVAISKNAVYYGGANVPDWVIAKQWIVKEVSGDRAVIDKSSDGKNAICSPINVKYLTIVSTSSPSAAADTVYVVVKGDTLSGIASKFCTTYQKLAAYNGIANPNLINVGQKIKIPANR